MSIDYAGWKVRPTIYQGLRMRSRLEATWAAFFDACGWRWEYEPETFGGWAPDFLLFGKSDTYVEVKPIHVFDEQVAAKIAANLPHGVEGLLLGQGPVSDDALGWFVSGGLDARRRLMPASGAYVLWARAKNAVQFLPPPGVGETP